MVELVIGGMTCASCAAARIEKKLNKLDGVTATVNFATQTARVAFPAAVSAGDLISVVERACLHRWRGPPRVLRDGAEVRVPAGQLAVGEEFVVRPGEKIAADGLVISGHSAVGTSMPTR